MAPEHQYSPIFVSGAVEGLVDETVLRRVVSLAGGKADRVHIAGGKHRLDRQLHGYNNAAKLAPWCVLRDLNGDALCAAELRSRLLPMSSPLMHFRIAVRSVEAWMIADRERIASFLSIPQSVVPRSPEDLPDPKQALVDLATRSHKRVVRDGIVPTPSSGRRVGPDYTSLMIEYVESRWRPEVAARNSESLCRCVRSLRGLAE